jgi:flavin reductase (DIM6/NTAB) family NADH-FMN oxidoreductase RutF
MARKSLPLSKVYGLLEPGPVLLLTTAKGEQANVMTMSWQTMLEFEPPTLACVISEQNYTFDILTDTLECVLNIPTVALAHQVVGCGNCSGRTTDKFKAFALTAAAASRVRAPLIDECYASIECKVVDTRMVDVYNLFVLQGCRAWIDPSISNPQTLHHRGKGSFMVAGETIKLPSRMK